MSSRDRFKVRHATDDYADDGLTCGQLWVYPDDVFNLTTDALHELLYDLGPVKVLSQS